MVGSTTTTTTTTKAPNKEVEIIRLLAAPTVDLWKLRALALSEGGLLNGKAISSFPEVHPHAPHQCDELVGSSLCAYLLDSPRTDSIRQRAWPLLVGLHSTTEVAAIQPSNRRHMASCLDMETIERDVARCTWHLLTGNQRAQRQQMEGKRHRRMAKLIRKKQTKLGLLIAGTLTRTYPSPKPTADVHGLRYYQGYHDVACIVLASLGGSGVTGPWQSKSSSSSSALSSWNRTTSSPGMELSSAVLLQLSKTHFRDFLNDDFQALQAILHLSVFPLLALWDRPLHNHLLESGMTSPFFLLSWVLTWFSHEIRDTTVAKRLFDFFIVSHPLMPLYLSVAMLLHPHNRREILETEADMGLLHQTLTSLPRNTNRVGWKYQPDSGGYRSDDEEDDDDMASLSTHESLEEEELLVFEADGLGRRTMSTESGESYDPKQAPVPLQELMDLAVAYMQALPPRQLLSLATRYHGASEVETTLAKAPGLTCFSADVSLSSWRLAAVAPTDPWYYETAAQTTKDKLPSQDWTLLQDADILRRLIHERQVSREVIASGFGTSRREQRATRRRRKRKVAAGVALILVFIVCAVQLHGLVDAGLFLVRTKTQLRSLAGVTGGILTRTSAEFLSQAEKACVYFTATVADLLAQVKASGILTRTSTRVRLYAEQAIILLARTRTVFQLYAEVGSVFLVKTSGEFLVHAEESRVFLVTTSGPVLSYAKEESIIIIRWLHAELKFHGEAKPWLYPTIASILAMTITGSYALLPKLRPAQTKLKASVEWAGAEPPVTRNS